MNIPITEIITFGGYVIAVGFGVASLWNRQTKERNAESDRVASELIENLQRTSNLQKEELLALRSKEIDQGKEIAHLQGQVKVLSDLFQGRDPAMIQFFKEAPDLIVSTRANSNAVSDLTKAITELITSMKNN